MGNCIAFVSVEKKRLSLVNRCYMCNREEEFTNSMFPQCAVAGNLVSWFFWFKLY